MLHTAHGYWIAEAGPPDVLPPLDDDIETDVLVVGGGFTGMWSAWHLKQLDPGCRVTLVDSDRIVHGPSGRNGGFVDSMWVSFSRLEERYGTAAAIEIAEASEDSVKQIGEFCEEQDVDAWFRHQGYLNVSTTSAQDGAWKRNLDAMTRAGVAHEAEVLGPEAVADVCRSPRFRGGIKYGAAATVQPARLGFGIRRALEGAGVVLHENCPVISVDDGPSGVLAKTANGSVRAERVILAIGPSLAGYGSPIRQSTTVASSHMVITEPVPELIEEIGWTGGEAISDCRALLTYFRTTPDGRIAFGWGGGRIAAAGRRHGRAELDPEVVGQVGRNLLEYFPGLAGRQLEYAWGGPIDASATHLPHAVALPSGRAFAAFGYTGNGVGPSQMIGRCLAAQALGREDRYSSLALVEPASALTRVPPEPFRWLGGTVIREAIGRKESAEAEGRRPGPVTSLIAAIPGLIGFHIGR
ncbi:MAG: FAD-dependent oxidoreductase [Thermoleophilia bacterium]|nr:FAD-dependent oxidoreductase [Thermoleophilia bacterium]